MKTDQERIAEMIEAGAVLTLLPQQTKALIAPQSVVVPAAGRLVYHDLAVDDQHGTHTLRFDRLEMPHALGVKFYLGGQWVAYLAPVSEEAVELHETWVWWHWAVKQGEIQEEWYRDQIRSRLYSEEENNVDMQ